MDLVSAIGLLSSFVTLEEAGRSWILIIKDKIKRKEIDINNWDSDDPLVQVCLDRFKTDMGDKYKDHIFSEEEIQDIILGFFEQNRELRIGNEEKKQMTQIIEDILYAYNEYAKSLMSSGERTLHNTLSSDFSKIMDKLGVIEEQPRKENIKKFLHAIEVSKEIVEQRMLNPEFAELVKVGKIYYNGQANENLDIAVMENRAGTLALKAMQIINELKRNWTDDSIDYWKALRELCLMRPTLSRKNVEQNSQYQLVYMCAPGEITAYSYEQEGDYNKNINIKFDGSLPQKMSEDEVHLKEIMQIPGVKALFEKHGYATSFVPNEFILTPPMFNNIYKGALGEVVGKYILEQYAGVTLQEMPPEFFELFDYTLGNGVYVDFKLWKETMLISAEEEKKNVLEKLDKCGGKRAVIINIMIDHNMQITSSDSGRIIEIPYLYRLDRKEIGTEIIAKINREGYLQ